MVKIKTQVNKASVKNFLNTIKNPEKRKDCKKISEIMEKVIGHKLEMWGTSIVGFGRKEYTYANGRTADWMMIGFSPRAQNIACMV